MQCRPSYNTGAETSSFDFSFVFYDECWDPQLVPPFSAGIDAPLFLETMLLYSKPESTQACGSFEDELVFLNERNNMPTISMTTNSKIRVMGTDPVDHIGEFFVRIHSCITVFDLGVPVFCPRCCTDSDPFSIKLFNACESSIIKTSPILNSMSAKQFEFDTQDLRTDANWPWTYELNIFG